MLLCYCRFCVPTSIHKSLQLYSLSHGVMTSTSILGWQATFNPVQAHNEVIINHLMMARNLQWSFNSHALWISVTITILKKSTN